MPRWWPLFQGDLTVYQWSRLKGSLESAWKFVNIAVNPFCRPDVFETIREQITVAQVPVGLADGIHSDGTIELALGMVRLTGATDCPRYSLLEYMTKLLSLDVAPTLIVLGPSLPTWSNAINQERVGQLIPVLRVGCDILWNGLSRSRRNMVWALSA